MEENKKKYDLEERTEKFSLRVRDFCLKIIYDTISREYIKQLVRSAGSIAANYIEANENLGSGDLKMKIRICRKESKESRLWLKHLSAFVAGDSETERIFLMNESTELESIFGAILRKLN